MLKLKQLIIILTLFFMMPPAVVWSQPIKKQPITQSKSKELTQQKASNQQNPPIQFVTSQQMIDAFTRAIEASNQKTKTYQPPSPPNNFSGLFQLLLTIFTGALVIVGGIQCYIIFNTLRETQKVANAAKESADVAEQALHISERAYLGVDVDKYQINSFGAGTQIRIDYEIKNSGHTPAQITESSHAIDIININNIPTEPNYNICKKHSFNHFIRADGGTANRLEITDKPITIDQFRDIKNGTCCVAIWGKIVYIDIFQQKYVLGFGAMYNYIFGNFILLDGYNYIAEYDTKYKQS